MDKEEDSSHAHGWKANQEVENGERESKGSMFNRMDCIIIITCDVMLN